MPIWGWMCVGLFGLTIFAVGLFYVFILLPYNRKQKRLEEDGQTVVAWIMFASPSLSTMIEEGLEAAFVIFTRDNDTSAEHLGFLKEIGDRLFQFKPKEGGNPDEKTIARAIAEQVTVGEEALRIPKRITGGQEVFFSTPNVKRRLLNGGKLTREYICLRVLINDDYRDVTMVEYPDKPVKRK